MDPPDQVLEHEETLNTYPSPDPDGQHEAGSFFGTDISQRDAPQSDLSNHGEAEAPHGASVEELQLAAQLGQDLAAEPMISMADPGIKFDDATLRTIMPHPDDPALRHIPHPIQHPARTYIAGDSAPTPPQAVPPPQPPMTLGQSLGQSLTTSHEDTTPPRKRSKVSRACDECRRKKVKCDAHTDTGDTPCSNCKRSSQRCSFSRIPQKRGPSKGYIKELADRINSIEGRLGDNAGFSQAPGPGDEVGRKRTFSSVSNGELNAPTDTRASTMAWSTELQPTAPSSSTPERPINTYQTNGLAPRPISLKPDTPPKPAATVLDGMSGDLPELSQPRDLDEDLFNGYMTIIHPYLPILPASKARLQVYLAQCSGMLREAFLEALAGTLHSFPSFTSTTSGDVGLAKKMLVEWELNDDAPRTQAAHIVHLQTILLLLIEADVRPAGSADTQKESLLGRAVGTAWALRLHLSRADATADTDPDADVHIRVRLWWSLVILDRWNAISMGTPTMTHRQAAVAQPGVSAIIGEVPWLLLRLSKVMDRIADVLAVLQKAGSSSSEAERALAPFLNDYIENFREDLPDHVDPLTYPVVHLTYWHCRLVAYLLGESAGPLDVIWPCREMVSLLAVVPQLSSPFQHHFRALAMLALAELSRIDKTKEEAGQLMAALRLLPVPTNSWNDLVGDRFMDILAQAGNGKIHPEQLAEVAASSSAAVESDSDKHTDAAPKPPQPDGNGVGFDQRRILTAGYFRFIRTIGLQS